MKNNKMNCIIGDMVEFDEKEGTVEATKINGKWNIIMNNLK